MNAKAGAQEQIHALHDTLIELSHRIHSNPEVGWEEEQAVAWLSEALSDRRNAEALGRSFADLGNLLDRAAASADMGNVSLVLPAIHPSIGINSLPAVNHQPEFAAHCVSEAADRALIDGALAMAWTAIDMVTDVRVRERLLVHA